MSTSLPFPFYRGNPPDGTAGSNDVTNVQVFDMGLQVPTYKRWLIEQIVVTNMTQTVGFFSVAVFGPGVNVGTAQPYPGAMNTASPLPRSIAGGAGVAQYGVHPLGVYIAFSQPVDPVTTEVFPAFNWALGDEKLWVGAYPGHNDLLGSGGICMTISGREYRD